MEQDIRVVRVEPQDIVTLLYDGSVGAGAGVTLVSKRLTFPFTTERFRVHFALNTNKTLRIRFFISADASAPTAQPVVGHNIFAPLGQVDYIVGDNQEVEVPYRVKCVDRGTYIKLFAENLDANPHTIDAHVFVSRLPEKITGDGKEIEAGG